TLSLLKHNNSDISCSVHRSLHNIIKGGSRPLDSIIPFNELEQNHMILQKFNLIYLDQFLDEEDTQLLD
ncbi:16178_t:CDS:1, partial [Funneliformis caledonium]